MIRENEEQTESEPSVLTTLRALIPQRPASFTETLRVAEQQAARLLNRFGIRQWPVPETILFELPHLKVEQSFGMPASGCHFWDSDRRTWVIHVNGSEPATRQRFSMLHEYKHIVDYGRYALLYGDGPMGRARAEQAAEFFAGCVLVPRSLLKRAWGDRVQQVAELAGAFDVSSQAMTIRLAQTGLIEDTPPCDAGREWLPGATVRSEGTRQSGLTGQRHLEAVPI